MHITLIIGSILFMTTSLSVPSLHTNLITFDKKPTPTFLALLSTCGIQHDGSLATIITATQKEQPEGFLRPKNKERWQLTSYFEIHTTAIIQQCAALHMLTEIKPVKMHYDYAILFGGIIQGVRARLAHLVQCWQEGVRWKQLIILTGQRPLDPNIEATTTWIDRNNGSLPIKQTWHLTDHPLMETDMIHMVLEQSILPAAWQNIPLLIVDTPMQKKGTEFIRPTTADTVYQWLSTHPSPGTILAISLQPLIGYQDAVLRRYLPSSFTLETVGPAAVNDLIKPEILIDTIARWLYNAQHL